MPPRNPSVVQLDNPALVDQTIRDLQLMGSVGLLNFSPEVVPVYLIGDAGITVSTTPVTYASGEIFYERGANMVDGEVICDTGNLAAGEYDLQAYLNGATQSTPGFLSRLELQHRNAADTGTLATWGLSFMDNCNNAMQVTCGLIVAENESFRAECRNDLPGAFSVTIMARRRTAL